MHSVPEERLEWKKMIYHNIKSHVRCSVGATKEFSVKVGVH